MARATSSAASSPGTSRASASTSTSGSSVKRSRPSAARGERAREIKVELPVDAHLPHDYVPGERLPARNAPQAGCRPRRVGSGRHPRRAPGPVWRTAPPGPGAARGGPGCGPCPALQEWRISPRRQLRPVRAGRAAGEPAAAATAAVPGVGRPAGAADGACSGAAGPPGWVASRCGMARSSTGRPGAAARAARPVSAADSAVGLAARVVVALAAWSTLGALSALAWTSPTATNLVHRWSPEAPTSAAPAWATCCHLFPGRAPCRAAATAVHDPNRWLGIALCACRAPACRSRGLCVGMWTRGVVEEGDGLVRRDVGKSGCGQWPGAWKVRGEGRATTRIAGWGLPCALYAVLRMSKQRAIASGCRAVAWCVEVGLGPGASRCVARPAPRRPVAPLCCAPHFGSKGVLRRDAEQWFSGRGRGRRRPGVPAPAPSAALVGEMSGSSGASTTDACRGSASI